MAHIKRVVFFWFPSFVWMGLIYFLSSFHKLQASPIDWQDFLVRKTAHFLEYGILCVLYYFSLRKTTFLPKKKMLIVAFILTVLYAFTDEWHQTMINGRTGKFSDVFIDSLGGIAGVLFGCELFSELSEKYKFLK